jgi:hypothetical protein
MATTYYKQLQSLRALPQIPEFADGQEPSHASSTGTTSDSRGDKLRQRGEARKRGKSEAKREGSDNLYEFFLKYEPSPNINKQSCKAQPYTLPAPRKILETQK